MKLIRIEYFCGVAWKYRQVDVVADNEEEAIAELKATRYFNGSMPEVDYSFEVVNSFELNKGIIKESLSEGK